MLRGGEGKGGRCRGSGARLLVLDRCGCLTRGKISPDLPYPYHIAPLSAPLLACQLAPALLLNKVDNASTEA